MSKTAERKSRATRIPDDFTLTPERRQYAERQGLTEPERVFEKFANHFRGASGANARKVDWPATWRKWCLEEADRAPRTRGGLQAGRSAWRPASD